MKVNGYEVPSEVEAAGVTRMKEMPQFRAADVETVIWQTMAYPPRTTNSVALVQRITDRLIQRERQAKRIKKAHKYPYWVWCGE